MSTSFYLGLTDVTLMRACPGYIPVFVTWFEDGTALVWRRAPGSPWWQNQGRTGIAARRKR